MTTAVAGLGSKHAEPRVAGLMMFIVLMFATLIVASCHPEELSMGAAARVHAVR